MASYGVVEMRRLVAFTPFGRWRGRAAAEEEGEMFRQARRVFDAAELEDLGARMQARKESASREMNIPLASM